MYGINSVERKQDSNSKIFINWTTKVSYSIHMALKDHLKSYELNLD